MSLLYFSFLLFPCTPSKGQAIVYLPHQVNGRERPDFNF